MEENTDINDIRVISSFKSITFSNFKKSEVAKQLILSLTETKLEQSIYWSTELICSGHLISLWDIIIQYYSKHIQISNPKLVIYIDVCFNKFRNILVNGYKDNELFLRNNVSIRKLFAEIVCILCLSKKHHLFQPIKINENDFILTNITDKLKAPNVDYIYPYYKDGDPKLLFIPFNEFVYNLTIKNHIESCYWFEYILDYENILKKKKEVCICETRSFVKVENNFRKDIVWIFWEIMLDFANTKGTIYLKILNSALNLFSIQYNNSFKKKRKYLLYFGITLLTINIILENEIVKDKEIISNVLLKIDKIYLQIKKNEISPNTEYLFLGKDNVKHKNLEKTIKQLELLNTFENDFIPRNKL